MLCILIIVIALAVIVLAWLTLKERKKKKVRKSEDRQFDRFSDMPVWDFSDTLQ